MSSLVDVDERGKQLRQDIYELYQDMQRNKSLRARPFTNNIKDFITRYIPEQTSFDDAEHILRAAEFEVDERPGINSTRDFDDKYDVIATMSFPRAFISQAEVLVALRPKSPGDYSTVNQIFAEINVTYP